MSPRRGNASTEQLFLLFPQIPQALACDGCFVSRAALPAVNSLLDVPANDGPCSALAPWRHGHFSSQGLNTGAAGTSSHCPRHHLGKHQQPSAESQQLFYAVLCSSQARPESQQYRRHVHQSRLALMSLHMSAPAYHGAQPVSRFTIAGWFLALQPHAHVRFRL